MGIQRLLTRTSDISVGGGVSGAGVNLGLPGQVRKEGGQRQVRGGVGGQEERLEGAV